MKMYELNPDDVRKAREFLKNNGHRVAPGSKSETVVQMANQLKQDLVKEQRQRSK